MAEAFERAKATYAVGAFLNVGFYAYEPCGLSGRRIIIPHASFKYVNREELEGRKYVVTLWDYRPGLMFYDMVFDVRNRQLIEFRSAEEAAAVEAYALDEFARLDKAIRTPYHGVW